MVEYLKKAGPSCILLDEEKKLRRKEGNNRPAEGILPQSGLSRQGKEGTGEHQEVEQKGEALSVCHLWSNLRGHEGHALLSLADAGGPGGYHPHPSLPRLSSPSHRGGLWFR